MSENDKETMYEDGDDSMSKDNDCALYFDLKINLFGAPFEKYKEYFTSSEGYQWRYKGTKFELREHLNIEYRLHMINYLRNTPQKRWTNNQYGYLLLIPSTLDIVHIIRNDFFVEILGLGYREYLKHYENPRSFRNRLSKFCRNLLSSKEFASSPSDVL